MASCSMFLQIISFVVMIMVGYLMEPSDAFDYYVGGKDGWSLKPSKTFNHWASLNRFQVHDSLIFKYEKGTDSVLQVDQEDYITCNKTNPILALENKGDYSTFDLDHSGFFFFISGHDDNCNKGEKVIVLVMAPRNYTHTSPTPAPQISPVSTQAPSPFQGVGPVSTQAPSPFQGVGPVSSQAPSPFQGISPHAPSPIFQGIRPVSSQAPSPFQGISSQAPSPIFQGIRPVSSQAPSPFQGISPHAPSPIFQGIRPVSSQAPSPSRVPRVQTPAPSPVKQITPPARSPFHVHAPAHAPIRQVTHGLPPAHSPSHKITPISSPSPSPIRQVPHVLPPAQSPHVHKITPISSPAPAPSRVGKTTHHHHAHSPAPSPIQKSTPISSPAPSPTLVNDNSPAAAPGPSDQAPSPDNGKSAAAATSFKGELLMAVMLFWIMFN